MGPEQQPPPPSPEQESQPARPLFDFEQMEAGEIVRIYAALEDSRDKDAMGDSLMNRFELELHELHDEEKTREVFLLMARHHNEWVRIKAADLAPCLLQFGRSSGYKARQEVVDVWLRLLDDEKVESIGSASQAMYEAIHDGSIEQSLAEYLLDKMSEHDY